jgi:aminomethyltransferase
MAQAHDAPLATPLAARHDALGARIVEFGGWLMPLQYSGILEEHRAVRGRAGLFDLSHMGELFVEGPEAAAALAYALTTDPASLKVGRAHYSMICFPEGGILDDLIVYRLADERYMVVANASNAGAVSDALAERLGGFSVVLDDRSLATALVAIQGPRAAEILAPLTNVPLDGLRYYAIQEGQVAGIAALVGRTGYTGEDGFEIFVDVTGAGRIWDVLIETGEAAGIVPVGLGARDTLRLEAGMPLYGNELGPDTTPFEAGLGRVVKLEKPGDFVGRASQAARRADRSRPWDRPARL